MDHVSGLGPLQSRPDDPVIEEKWVDEPTQVFLARHGESELTSTVLSDQQLCGFLAFRSLAEQALQLGEDGSS